MPIYKGKFRPKHLKKYHGDPTQIVYRSGWELSVMSWCDTTSDVKFWSSETIVVPYLSPLDRKIHRYFVDFTIEFKNGNKYLVEVKPYKQTKPPKKRKKTTKKYIKEVFTWGINIAKWDSAMRWAKKNDYKFEIWTEHTLKNMGIIILG